MFPLVKIAGLPQGFCDRYPVHTKVKGDDMEEYSFLSKKAMLSQVHISNFFLSNAPINHHSKTPRGNHDCWILECLFFFFRKAREHFCKGQTIFSNQQRSWRYHIWQFESRGSSKLQSLMFVVVAWQVEVLISWVKNALHTVQGLQTARDTFVLPEYYSSGC